MRYKVKDIINDAILIGMDQVKKEMTDFAVFFKYKNINNVLEIGTARGGSFYVLCKISEENGKKISLDWPFHGVFRKECEYNVDVRNTMMRTWSKRVFIVDGDSHKQEIFLKIREILQGEEIDLLFIDGDHSYEGVKKDYEMYGNLVKKNGYIAFHDINGVNANKEESGEVFLFWKELKGAKIEFNTHHPNFGIGLLQKQN